MDVQNDNDQGRHLNHSHITVCTVGRGNQARILPQDVLGPEGFYLPCVSDGSLSPDLGEAQRNWRLDDPTLNEEDLTDELSDDLEN